MKNLDNDNLITIKAPITEVMVYPYSARIKRKMSVKVSEGISKIFVADLPQSIVNDSVKADVRGKKDAIIKNLNLKKHFEKKISTEELETIRKEVKKLRRIISKINSDLIRLDEEFIQIAKTNITPPTRTSKQELIPMPLYPKSWNAYIDFIHNKLQENRNIRRKLLVELLDMRIQLKQKLREEKRLSSYLSYSSFGSEIIIQSNSDGMVEVELNYIVNNLQWFPVYDLRIMPEDKKAILTTYAIVKQNSGEDWKNIPLSFSTASPHISTDIVKLKSWRIKQAKTDIQIQTEIQSSTIQSPAQMDVYEKAKTEDGAFEMEKLQKFDNADYKRKEKKELNKKKRSASLKKEKKSPIEKASQVQQKAGMFQLGGISDSVQQQQQQQQQQQETDKDFGEIISQDISSSTTIYDGDFYDEKKEAKETIVKKPQSKKQSSKQNHLNYFGGKKQKSIFTKSIGEQSQQISILENLYMDEFSYDEKLDKNLPKSSYIGEEYRYVNVCDVAGGYDYRFSSVNLESILSRNEPSKVTLNMDSQEIELIYQSIPIETQKVYLKAKYKNDGDAPILSGSVKIFMDSDFIGESFIDTISPGEEASFSLGIDEDIKIIRREKSKREKSGLLGKNVIIAFDNEIEIKNYKAETVTVEIFDRIPQSGLISEINIFDLSYSIKPDLDTKRGVVMWKVTLKKDEKKIINFEYKVKSPEDFQLVMSKADQPYWEGEK